jgi:indolepyruvate decarboxylase
MSTMSSQITIADYIVWRLKELGCHYVFGVPATSCADFFSTVHDATGIDAVVSASELEAGYAADGYARFAPLGIICVAYGVGTLSLINAVAGSLVEKVPVVVLNGGPSQEEVLAQDRYGALFLHSTGRPDLDYRVFREVTVAAHVIREGEDIPAAIDAVLRAAISELGPVYLEIPNDMWLDFVEAPTTRLAPSPPRVGPKFDAFLQAALAKAATARYPAILLGVELVRRGLRDETLALLAATGYPFVTTVLSKSFLPEAHPQFHGTYDTDLVEKPARTLLEASDCLIALGCVFGADHFTLLETQYSDMINVSFGTGRLGEEVYEDIDLARFLPTFRPTRRITTISGPTAAGYPDRYALRRVSWASQQVSEARQLTHEALFSTVDDFLRETDGRFVTVLDTCLGSFPGADLVMHQEDSYVANPVWLSIGHSTPASIGAHWATGRRPLIITGDGGFQMVVQSVSTMVKHHIPSILIIVNNGSYAIEQFLLNACYFVKEGHAPLPFVALHAWNYEQIPELFGGGRGVTVNSVDELRAALEQAREVVDGPFIISALVPSNDLPPENVPLANAKCRKNPNTSDTTLSRWVLPRRHRHHPGTGK